MNYPVWEVEAGHGLIVAVVAVLHTFVSQFAIGTGLLLVVAEWRARRRGDAGLLGWLHRHARMFVGVSLVFGALSGVGIWFVIGLVNPAGTSALIHAFVWGWAIEWVFFFVEIAAALVYVHSWDRLSPRRHMQVGWVYFGAAWMSLVVINGIVTFMLTPGRWTETRSFWDGILNPTYAPSLALRTAICVALAGGWALVTATRERDAAVRARAARLAGTWTLGGLLVAAPAALWYWSAAVAATRGAGPLSGVELAVTETVPTARTALALLPWLWGAALLAGGALVVAFPRALRTPQALLAMAALLGALGCFEWIREGARKPWLVHGYVYANGDLAAGAEEPLEGGLAAHAVWLAAAREGEDAAAHGERLFRVACRNCHTVDGYLGIRARVAGRPQAWIADALATAHTMRAPMPPFRGSEAERAALASYLATLGPYVELTYDDADVAPAGTRVFARDCAPCHVDASRVARAFRDFEPEDAVEWLDSIEEMFEGRMPRFHGSEREKAALGRHLAAAGAAVSEERP